MKQSNPIKVIDIIEAFNLNVVCGKQSLDNVITGGYASDLLSDVIANIVEGDIWLTLQGHPNIVAVAILKDISGIVLINGHQPDQETIVKAETEGLPILTSDLPVFELVGKLYKYGIPGLH